VRRATFLDRDGVLVDDDLAIVDGAGDATSALRAAGFVLVMVTNQPNVARGTAARAEVERMNASVQSALGLDDVRCCFHDEADDCACRKPKPGMILDAARDLELDLDASWLVGDRWVDIGAGAAAGVQTVLVERDYSWDGTHSGAPEATLAPTARATSLTDAVSLILERDQSS
jgi:D-glycero-D-manno-heptose 1,7-bisphosphate phosphatase